jgi:hypothetical protein
LSPDVLLEQDGAELFEAGGRILERPEDRLSLVDLEGENPGFVGNGVAEPEFECSSSTQRATSRTDASRIGMPAR